MLGRIRKIHFVGIGGSGMSGIAEVMLNLGFFVSGSDARRSAVTDRLARLGARISEGHAAENLKDAQVAVISSAISPDNPEVREAHRRGIPVIPRAEMLAELMRMKFSIAVAGAHGKTTTTSMIAVMLAEAGLDPTAVIGGRLDTFGSNARLGKGELMVVEADESDRSFLLLLPTIAVVTNIDREHLDHYRDLDEIARTFASFLNKTPFYGAIVACVDPPWKATFETIAPSLTRRVVTYGFDGAADVCPENVELGAWGASFEAISRGKSLGRMELHVTGRHNVQNALAAVAVARELDLTEALIRRGLGAFRGADRRFQVKGEVEGVTVVDDYGHHPNEIRATLEVARLRNPRRVLAIFQPHRYTRTQMLRDDFARCFGACDRVYVLDIYSASEAPIPGVTAERLVDRMRELGFDRATYLPSEIAAVEEASRAAEPGDLIITIGAGSVGKLGDLIVEGLRSRVPIRRGSAES